MAELQGVLGGILRDLTRGRAMGDLTSFEVAQMYRQNELLATFSIPRFRIDDVEIELRFALDSPVKSQSETTRITDEKSAELERAADQVVERTYREFPELAKSKQFSETFAVGAVRSAISRLGDGPGIDVDSAVDQYMSAVSERLREPLLKETRASEQEHRRVFESMVLPLLTRRVREVFSVSLTGLQTRQPSTLEVIVEAARLAELRPDQISTLRMRLSDNDRMWGSTTLSSGEQVDFITDHG